MHLFSFLRRLILRLSCPSLAHYVAGAPSLPPPLTPEEEKDPCSPRDDGRGPRRAG